MADIQAVHLVSKSVPNGERFLGVVVDDAELDLLQGEESAMPVDAHLRPAVGVVVDGAVFVMGEPQIRAALPVFVVEAYHTKAAERDAAIAELHPEVRAEIAGTDWEPEATKIERRTTEAREARQKAEAARAEATIVAEPAKRQ